MCQPARSNRESRRQAGVTVGDRAYQRLHDLLQDGAGRLHGNEQCLLLPRTRREHRREHLSDLLDLALALSHRAPSLVSLGTISRNVASLPAASFTWM